MSDYQQFLKEQKRINVLFQNGYKITHITENLSGAFVKFQNSKSQNPLETIHLLTADARKYVSVMLIQQSGGDT
jgi:hypothetical protein